MAFNTRRDNNRRIPLSCSFARGVQDETRQRQTDPAFVFVRAWRSRRDETTTDGPRFLCSFVRGVQDETRQRQTSTAHRRSISSSHMSRFAWCICPLGGVRGVVVARSRSSLLSPPAPPDARRRVVLARPFPRLGAILCRFPSDRAATARRPTYAPHNAAAPSAPRPRPRPPSVTRARQLPMPIDLVSLSSSVHVDLLDSEVGRFGRKAFVARTDRNNSE